MGWGEKGVRVCAVSAGARARERTVSGLRALFAASCRPGGGGAFLARSMPAPAGPPNPSPPPPSGAARGRPAKAGGKSRGGRCIPGAEARVSRLGAGGERAPARPHLSPMRVPTDGPPPPARTPKTRPAGAPGLSLTRQGRASVRARACAPSLPGARHLLCSRPRLLSLSLAARTFSRRWTRPTGNCRSALADLETAFLEGPPLPAPRVPCACRKKRSGWG